MLRTHPGAPPEGFEPARLGGTIAWTRPETRDWVRDAIDRHGTLYEAARVQSAGNARLEGRAPVYLVRCDPEGDPDRADRVVRHYVRGGAVASLLGDRYLRAGVWRPMLETVTSERLRSNGLPTPRVLAAAVYPSGPVYRADLVTEFVPTCGDLGRILFEEAPPLEPPLRREALRAVGGTIRKLAELGVRHPDVNVKNFLVDSQTRPPRIHLLDLDRCRFGRPLPERAARRMGRRLASSLRKWERLHGASLAPGEWAALEEGLGTRREEGISPSGR